MQFGQVITAYGFKPIRPWLREDTAHLNGTAGAFVICCETSSEPLEFEAIKAGQSENLLPILNSYGAQDWSGECKGRIFFFVAKLPESARRHEAAHAMAEHCKKNN